MADFVQWLESLQTDSIILLTHETRKTVPLFLLEVLKKYNLYERFCKVVKGFANTYLFAEAKCAETVKSYSLYSLCTVLLDKDEELDNALDRARLTYQVNILNGPKHLPTALLYANLSLPAIYQSSRSALYFLNYSLTENHIIILL